MLWKCSEFHMEPPLIWLVQNNSYPCIWMHVFDIILHLIWYTLYSLLVTCYFSLAYCYFFPTSCYFLLVTRYSLLFTRYSLPFILTRYFFTHYLLLKWRHLKMLVVAVISWIFLKLYHLKYHCVKCVQMRSFFLSVFSRIRTEYGEIRSISPYSVRIQENTDQKKHHIWTLLT